MSLVKSKWLSDVYFSRVIQLAVLLLVSGCIISQVMMQLGGGVRDMRVDLTDQIAVSYTHLTLPTIA